MPKSTQSPLPLTVSLHIPDAKPAHAEIAQAAERAGITAINFPDSPLIYPEVYISCAASLLSTSSLEVQTGATNPVTRHPSVTAGTAITLSELAPKRVGIGIATGDSACWGVGLRPARIAELCEYIVALRALVRGKEATWRGATFQGHWTEFDPSLAPPVYVACSGPKLLQAAAQVADGLLIEGMGYAPEDIARVKGLIDQACSEVGRDPSELEVWWGSEFAFGDDPEVVMAKHIMVSHWLLMGDPIAKGVPEAILPALRELHADTKDLDTFAEMSMLERRTKRAKELGIYDWLTARSARLFGTPEDVRKRMDELRQHGIEKWSLAPMAEDGARGSIEKLGSAIAPR